MAGQRIQWWLAIGVMHAMLVAGNGVTPAAALTPTMLLLLTCVHVCTDFTNVFGTYIPPCFGLPPIPGFLTNEEFNRAVSNIALNFVYLAIGAPAALPGHCPACSCYSDHGATTAWLACICRAVRCVQLWFHLRCTLCTPPQQEAA